jgi:hypothetical protein
VLARGSPARALHELMAVERERIGELLSALAESSAQVRAGRDAFSIRCLLNICCLMLS